MSRSRAKVELRANKIKACAKRTQLPSSPVSSNVGLERPVEMSALPKQFDESVERGAGEFCV
jgi:hypothetical protein